MNIVATTGGDPVPLSRSLTGDIFVVRRFLTALYTEKLVTDAILHSVGSIAGADTARSIRLRGLEYLHEFLSIDQVKRIIVLAEKRLTFHLPYIVRELLENRLQCDGKIWVNRSPILRFHLPFDFAREQTDSMELFKTRYAEGRLAPLRPHRDSWFAEPKSCINIWIALSAITKGNGLSIYPEYYCRQLSHEPNAGVAEDQPVGLPVNFELAGGDALIFHADHLHASELNYSRATRNVLSLRFSLEDPVYTSLSPYRYVRIARNQPLSFLALHPLCRLVNRPVSRLLTKIKRTTDLVSTDNKSKTQEDRPAQSLMDITESTIPEHEFIPVYEFPVEQAVPISRDRCAIKLKNGLMYSFNRFCPHQGADLSLGHFDGGNLMCPWHNLPFDIVSGSSPCNSLRGLDVRMHDVSKDDNIVT